MKVSEALFISELIRTAKEKGRAKGLITGFEDYEIIVTKKPKTVTNKPKSRLTITVDEFSELKEFAKKQQYEPIE